MNWSFHLTPLPVRIISVNQNKYVFIRQPYHLSPATQCDTSIQRSSQSNPKSPRNSNPHRVQMLKIGLPKGIGFNLFFLGEIAQKTIV